MPMRRAAFAAGLVCVSVTLRAQTPRGAENLSAGAVAESLAVLQRLDSAVRAHPKDAAAWYRRGMVAWALSVRDQAKPPIKGLDHTRLGRLADTSLRIASQLAPDSTRFWVASGRYLISSGWGPTKLMSSWIFGGAIDAARKNLDPDDHAQAAIDMGRVNWRRYESRANRQLELDPGAAPRSMAEALNPLLRAAEALYGAANMGTISGGIDYSSGALGGGGYAAASAIQSNVSDVGSMGIVGLGTSRPELDMGTPQLAFKDATETFNRLTKDLPPDVQGEADYTRAELLFREAYDAAPRYERSLPSLAMLLAEKNRWAELATLARAHVNASPWDPWAWLSLGLASHRRGDDKMAAAAFDSAMVYLAPADRGRLDQLERLLPPKDSARVANMGLGDRAAIQRLYWLATSPLWSQEGGSPRLEFLSRVTYAELRWSVLELKLHGADTDRGNIYIRYGPPDKTFTIAPDMNHQITDVTTVWIYNSGLMFIFVGPPAFGVARFPYTDRAIVESLTEAQPVRWDNIASVKIDSMPVQSVRFRAGDSVDVVLATRANVDTIQKSSDVAGPVNAFAYWLGGGTVTAARDSVLANRVAPNVFRHRLAPGAYLVRAEATAQGSTRAGRASALVVAMNDSSSGFTLRGFGISDVLLATSLRSELAAPARWTDLDAAPLAGPQPKGAPLGLVWENYSLTNEDGHARYAVTLTLERVRGGSGRVVAEILDRIGGAIGVERSGDRVVNRYDRTVAYAPTITDHILMSLGETPPGDYQLTLQITDAVNGKSTSRTTRFSIRE
ncbi:MAG TPA: GWxTD domain-containing protein [Gemmatimonadaceae bacterium]|nr:GWxTD domain-containing protein [Gemmatimonadaceae bacterium]